MGGQNVLVIGGSAGLGKEMSKVLAARGDNVTIVARKKAQLDEARQEILLYRRSEIQTVTSIAADMSNVSAVNTIPPQSIKPSLIRYLGAKRHIITATSTRRSLLCGRWNCARVGFFDRLGA